MDETNGITGINGDGYYWFQDLTELFNINKLDQVIPKPTLTYTDKVNAIVRLSLYVGIIAAIYKNNYLFLYIPIATMAFTLIVGVMRVKYTPAAKPTQSKVKYTLSPKATPLLPLINIESPHENNCVMPTKDNPYMNPLPFEDADKKPACNIINPAIRKEAKEKYDATIQNSQFELYEKSYAGRQFYTVPSTTYPNRQDEFARWLYHSPPTCKEGNGAQCNKNNMPQLIGSFREFN